MPTGLGGPMVVLVNRSLVKLNVKYLVHRRPLSRAHMYLELALDVKEGMSRGLSKSDEFLWVTLVIQCGQHFNSSSLVASGV